MCSGCVCGCVVCVVGVSVGCGMCSGCVWGVVCVVGVWYMQWVCLWGCGMCSGCVCGGVVVLTHLVLLLCRTYLLLEMRMDKVEMPDCSIQWAWLAGRMALFTLPIHIITR